MRRAKSSQESDAQTAETARNSSHLRLLRRGALYFSRGSARLLWPRQAVAVLLRRRPHLTKRDLHTVKICRALAAMPGCRMDASDGRLYRRSARQAAQERPDSRRHERLRGSERPKAHRCCASSLRAIRARLSVCALLLLPLEPLLALLDL
jgi:hypothetical protein